MAGYNYSLYGVFYFFNKNANASEINPACVIANTF